MRSHAVWVLVADAQRARLLQREKPGGDWVELAEEGLAVENPPTHLQGADRPGRVFDSTGQHRHAVETHDFHEAAKQDFAKALLHRLEQAQASGRFERLMLVAPPHFLGLLRAAISPALLHALRGSIDKDLTKATVAEIVHHLPEFRPA